MGDRIIAENYVKLLRAGKRTLDSIPKNLPEGVWVEIEKILKENPLPTTPKEASEVIGLQSITEEQSTPIEEVTNGGE